MDELIDITDENGNISGKTCPKSEAHQKGYWHTSIHVWLYTKEGKLLIQKRSDNKDTFPSLWDVSVAGHIGAGESPLDGAKREVFEEIGLTVSVEELQKIGTRKSNRKHGDTLLDNEFQHVYIAQLMTPIDKLKLQAEEVADLKLISISQLRKEVYDQMEKSLYVPYPKKYLDMIFNAVKEKITRA
ncbi:NUDIX hydrolase [Costertonia aggregata]|uniref:NUDIX domain-containing protein n=1 Tax=Costertonia aggregata TaxID=343403 RepID=A0A7H9AMT9_9FLAO|nr:NUDIX domain-containing protein [Costertonia aggregata]QLG44769.1 NUDIX domain-containing protein [Costertonia aggregata]